MDISNDSLKFAKQKKFIESYLKTVLKKINFSYQYDLV